MFNEVASGHSGGIDDIQNFTVQVFNEYDSVRAHWERLEREACCYGFQSFTWISTLLETFGREDCLRPAIVLVTDILKTPVMLIPLMVSHKYSVASLQFIDFGLVDYNAPLIRRDVAICLSEDKFPILWRRIIITIVSKVCPIDVIRLEKMPDRIDSVPNPFLQLACRQQEMSFQAQLVGNFETFTKSRSSSLMANSRAKRRRLAKQGLVEFRIAANLAELQFFTNTMIRQKSKRYRTTGAINIFRNSAFIDFYQSISRKAGVGGIIHLSALCVEGSIAAVHFGLVFRGRLYWLMPAFDLDRFSRFSPGRLLMLDLLQWAFDQKLAVFDFTIGDDEYKLNWADQTMPLYVHYAAATARGTLLVHSLDVYFRMKTALRIKFPQLFKAVKSLRANILNRNWRATLWALSGLRRL